MAINAGNQIRKMPYEYGGGHAVLLRLGLRLLGRGQLRAERRRPASRARFPPATSPRSWGSAGKGSWITVYANGGHAYMVVAGLRFDTSAVGERLNAGSGPRWRASKRPAKGYTAKYYPSL